MESIWLQTDENPKTDSLDSTFFGVFNKDPLEIGYSLSRPITPFQTTDSLQTQLASPIKPTEIIYSQSNLYSTNINDYDTIIDHPVKRRDSNAEYQLNLVPV